MELSCSWAIKMKPSSLRSVTCEEGWGPGKPGLEGLRAPQPRVCPALRFRHVKFAFPIV